MGKEGKGGRFKEVWSQFLGQQRWGQQGAASAAMGDAPEKEKNQSKESSVTEGARRHNGEREAEQEQGELVAHQHPPAAQSSHYMILEIFEGGLRDGEGMENAGFVSFL